MVFKTVNLDGLMCIKKFEVSLQVANRIWFNNIQKRDLNSNSNLNQDYSVELHCRCIVGTL
jgi:hypothetical protein